MEIEYQPDMFRHETPWLQHDGKTMPVRKGTYVEVMYRDGQIARDLYDWPYSWYHDQHSADIIAYRVLQNGKA